MKKMDMNLLDGYKRVTKVRANIDATNRVYISILVGLLLILGAFWGKLLIDNSFIKQDIEAIEEYVNSPQVARQIEEINALQREIEQLETILSQVNAANNAFDYMPRYDSSMIYMFMDARPGTVRINSFAFTGDKINLSISGTRIYSVSDYVLRLRRLNYFQDIRYSGYSYQDGMYIAEIECIVKGGN